MWTSRIPRRWDQAFAVCPPFRAGHRDMSSDIPAFACLPGQTSVTVHLAWRGDNCGRYLLVQPEDGTFVSQSFSFIHSFIHPPPNVPSTWPLSTTTADTDDQRTWYLIFLYCNIPQ